MKFGVIVFPGSNCDHDAYHVISKHVGQPVDFIWHRETDLSSYDAVILPGGFFVRRLPRAGALARFSPVMNSVKKFAESGRFVLGICNGFQILCEAGLLPGALIRNRDLHFICEHVYVRVETFDSPFTNELKTGLCCGSRSRTLKEITSATTARSRSSSRKTASSFATAIRTATHHDAANPNGSRDNIAGICNRERNVVGLMPHPERAVKTCSDRVMVAIFSVRLPRLWRQRQFDQPWLKYETNTSVHHHSRGSWCGPGQRVVLDANNTGESNTGPARAGAGFANYAGSATSR